MRPRVLRSLTGEDEIIAEMLKAINRDNMKQLQRMFNKVYKEEKVPSKWKKGIIVKYRKKATLAIATTGEE